MAPVWPSLSELSVEALGANRATLSWPTALDESGVARYSIFQDEVLIAAVPGDVTRAQIGPLSPNLAYAFSVRAEDEYGNSSILGPGGTLTLPDTAEPIFPAERVLDIVQTGHAEVTLRWTPATDDVSVVSYRVFQDHQVIADVAAPETVFVVSNLVEATDYFFRVEALDAAGNQSVNGPMRAFVVQDQSGPSWPMDGRLWATEISEESLRLNWTAAADASGIRMYRVFQSGVEVALVADPQLWVRLDGLTPNTDYDFDIVAEDRLGNRSVQGLHATITTVDQTAPMWPQDAALLVRSVNGQSATIGWSAAHDEGQLAGYILFRDEIAVAQVAPDQTEAVVENIAILTDYAFRVEAYDAAGNQSIDGPRLHVRLDDANPPTWGADARLTVLSTTPLSADVTWTAATDDVAITGYEVAVGGRTVATTSANTLTTRLAPLEPNSS